MSSFLSVELKHASRLLNPGVTVLVTSVHGGARNVMAAAWSMPVEFTPPRIAVVIDKSTFTRELVAASGVFGICIPGTELVDLTYRVGTCSGRDADKFGSMGISAQASPICGVPVLTAGCSAWMECRLLPEPRVEDLYDTCFGEVLGAAADPRIFKEGKWSVRPDNASLHTLHHLGAGNFAVAGHVLKAR